MIKRACIAAIIWAALTAPPSFAAAAGATASEMHIDLRSHDGYRVHLFAAHSTALLQVIEKKKVGHLEARTDYLTRIAIAGDTIKGDFGELGRISMRFVPSAAPPSQQCERSEIRTVRHGSYVGSLSFHGESGYVDVDVRRAGGTLVTPVVGSHCEDYQATEHRSPSHRRKLTDFYASLRRGVQATQFWAETNERGRAQYTAIVEGGGERMATYHVASVEASPLTFATDSALSFLSISPPYPFSGTGLVQRNPDGSRTWSGSLGVSFPGDPDVPLTGPEFRTYFTRQW